MFHVISHMARGIGGIDVVVYRVCFQASAACRATCGATRVRKCACTLNVIHSFSTYLPREARPHCIYAMALRTGGEDCYLALAALASQPLESGTLSLYLSVPVPVLTPSVVISRPTTASRPSTPLNPSPLAPQIYLLTYLHLVLNIFGLCSITTVVDFWRTQERPQDFG